MAIIIQRPLKGSRISSFYPVKTLPPLSALDSAFQLQEYISLLIRLDVHDVERIVSVPGKGEGQENGDSKSEDKDGEKDGMGGVTVDEACWVYEQLRRLAQDLSHPLITMLQQECTRSTCPEMKAGEWLYLCVAHGNDGAMEQCCAIDYILHTLDSATALLNSPRAFPSRLSVPSTSHRHFSSLARRLGRIFAHAYFHHREAFEQAEAESSLYARFLALTSKFDLVPAEFLVIPPRLTAMSDDERGGRSEHVEPPRLLAASLDPRRDLGRDDGGWSPLDRDRGPSPPGAPAQRGESPRKFGRNRTDTMVYSEAYSVAEELAKSDLSEVDIDREIAVERAAAAVGADLPTDSPDVPVENRPQGSEEVHTALRPPEQAKGTEEQEEEEDEEEDEEDEGEESPTEESPPEAEISQEEPIIIIVPSRPEPAQAEGEAAAEPAEEVADPEAAADAESASDEERPDSPEERPDSPEERPDSPEERPDSPEEPAVEENTEPEAPADVLAATEEQPEAAIVPDTTVAKEPSEAAPSDAPNSTAAGSEPAPEASKAEAEVAAVEPVDGTKPKDEEEKAAVPSAEPADEAAAS
ncbi:Mob1/phocein [Daedaleopsis nitida]|nr:Mob1/phocein [Daedaleopsis nitida]